MPKHRSTVYTVVRERRVQNHHYVFNAVIGTYTTQMRAEEVRDGSKQAFLDAGAEPDEYAFSVHPVTFYAE